MVEVVPMYLFKRQKYARFMKELVGDPPTTEQLQEELNACGEESHPPPSVSVSLVHQALSSQGRRPVDTISVGHSTSIRDIGNPACHGLSTEAAAWPD